MSGTPGPAPGATRFWTTARVMEADACLLFLYDKPKDELYLEATNKDRVEEIKQVRIPLGEGIEGPRQRASSHAHPRRDRRV